MSIFNIMRNKWLRRNALNSDKISADQHILEVLAQSPAITLQELVRRTPESNENKIKRTLSKYISLTHRPLFIGMKAPGRIRMRKHWEILLHNVIRVKHNIKGTQIYELSLFGVMLVLSIVRYNDMGMIKQGLKYKDVGLGDYFDKISYAYKDKLPLIFGKWYLLKRILKTCSAYNFDITLAEESYSSDSSKSVLMGGNKEIYDSVRAAALYSSKQLGKIQLEGVKAFHNFGRNKSYYLTAENNHSRKLKGRRPDYTKAEAINYLLLKITISLWPFAYDPKSYKKELQHMRDLSEEEAERLTELYTTEILAQIFAEEVTFFYYMNLRTDYFEFHVIEPTEYLSCLRMSEEVKPTELEPMQCLLLILQSDEQIRELVSYWLQDSVKYQQDVLETMDELYNKIRK